MRKKRTKKPRNPLTPEQKEKRKKAFKFFSHLVIGAVKIWLNGSPYILLIDQVDDFIKSYPEGIKKQDLQQ